MLDDHRPIGAYHILEMLGKEGFSSTPPIAYRVLDFLIEQGFVHKIKKLNAFIACSHPGNSHSPTFMICRKCEKVAEIDEKKSGLKLDKKSLSEFNIKCWRNCHNSRSQWIRKNYTFQSNNWYSTFK